MKLLFPGVRRRYMAVVGLCGNLILQMAHAQTGNNSATLLEKINIVDFSKPAGAWSGATIGQSLAVHDRLRTGEESRAAARLGDASVLRVDELTTIEILAPKETTGKATLDMKQGSTYFFSREKAREISFQTPAANGAIRGTEFLLTVTPQLHTILAVLKGEVELYNSHGSVLVHAGEAVDVAPDNKPEKKNAISTEAVSWPLLIESKLAGSKILKSASKSDLLRAVDASMLQWRPFAPQIIKATVKARKELALEIVRAAIEALGIDDPELIARVVAGAVAADPADRSAIVRLACELAPNCCPLIERWVQTIAWDRAGTRPFDTTGISRLSDVAGQANVVSPEKPPGH